VVVGVGVGVGVGACVFAQGGAARRGALEVGRRTESHLAPPPGPRRRVAWRPPTRGRSPWRRRYQTRFLPCRQRSGLPLSLSACGSPACRSSAAESRPTPARPCFRATRQAAGTLERRRPPYPHSHRPAARRGLTRASAPRAPQHPRRCATQRLPPHAHLRHRALPPLHCRLGLLLRWPSWCRSAGVALRARMQASISTSLCRGTQARARACGDAAKTARRPHRRTRGRWTGHVTRGTMPKSSRPPPSAAASALAKVAKMQLSCRRAREEGRRDRAREEQPHGA
jgi:hypothetical protein